jgi:hypothetical protein
MSMDDAVVNHDVRDADMSEAATDDVDLARGECFLMCFSHYSSSHW